MQIPSIDNFKKKIGLTYFIKMVAATGIEPVTSRV